MQELVRGVGPGPWVSPPLQEHGCYEEDALAWLTQIQENHRGSSKHIEEGSTLCTDKNRAYRQLVGEKNLTHVVFDSSKREYSRGQFGIQRINNYHGRLQKFLDRFDGVSTKYLDNYLVWHNFVNHAKEARNEKLRILQELVMAGRNGTRGYSVSWRPLTPFEKRKR